MSVKKEKFLTSYKIPAIFATKVLIVSQKTQSNVYNVLKMLIAQEDLF